ncbi:hypothetical protein KCP75_00425 [Salmonella enterica subsp. enterica]|nr:hypothetical protein KCP75_00425 [Salmonella enterica subsp. enterica]
MIIAGHRLGTRRKKVVPAPGSAEVAVVIKTPLRRWRWRFVIRKQMICWRSRGGWDMAYQSGDGHGIVPGGVRFAAAQKSVPGKMPLRARSSDSEGCDPVTDNATLTIPRRSTAVEKLRMAASGNGQGPARPRGNGSEAAAPPG